MTSIEREMMSQMSEPYPSHKGSLLDACRDVLRRVQWTANDESGPLFCPSCEAEKDDGHAPDCELRALLSRLEG